MSERLSTAEASKALGVPAPTIKHWLGQLPIPAEKDGAGRWRYSEEALKVLETVKELRGQNRTFETIRRRIDIDPSSPASAHSTTDELALSANEPELSSELSADDLHQALDMLSAEIAKNQALQVQVSELNATCAMFQERSEQLRAVVDSLQGEIKLLKAAPERDRPWWKRWL